jgi:hypothetical protein
MQIYSKLNKFNAFYLLQLYLLGFLCLYTSSVVAFAFSASMADKLLKRRDKSWIKSFSFHCNRCFSTQQTEGKQSKNISFPIRFAAWT